ncbi:MAG: cytochrome c biogenesis CcdA family protein [Alphaproteobacteria bacterium]
MDGLSVSQVIALAVADAVNPCEFAVLTIILVSITAHNPDKKEKVLWAGLSFGLAVFIMYLFYGIFIIKSFQVINETLTGVRFYLYKGLGVLAILLGAFQIKDFFFYKEGGFAREMPMSWRPTFIKVARKITSPVGAFFIGLFVTVFLLPCTIGPYIILGGALSVMDIIQTLPMLILYNLIFVAPVFIITGVVYFGLSQVRDVQKWKEKYIRVFHLFAGLIIGGFGIAMLVGWF